MEAIVPKEQTLYFPKRCLITDSPVLCVLFWMDKIGCTVYSIYFIFRQTFCAYNKELDNHNSTIFKVRGTC